MASVVWRLVGKVLDVLALDDANHEENLSDSSSSPFSKTKGLVEL